MTDTLDNFVLAQIVIIGLCVVVQNSWPRRFVAAIFASAIIGHDWFFHTISADLYWYFLSAGILDYAVIILILRMKNITKLGLDIQIIAFASFMYNLVGWMYAGFGVDTAVYSSMYLVLYSWSIFVLLRGEPQDVGYSSMDSWVSAFRNYAYSQHLIHNRNEKTQ